MLESNRVSMRAAVELLLGQNVEAIVLIAAHRSALEAMQGVDLGIPLLAVESSGRSGFHSVSIDHFAGAYAATNHLIELGHTNILHLAGPRDSMDAIERINGWRSALSDRSIKALEPLYGDWSPRSGYQLGEEIASNRSVSAVFAANDQMALGLIRSLSSHGIAVPDDISIIGFDDIPEAEYFMPPLTTIRQDFTELGQKIMSTLVEILRGETDVNTLLPIPRIVLRHSTGPVSALRQ